MYCFLNPPLQVVPGRMALLVTLFLVLINIFNNVTNVSPNTEGMTAISSWMLGQSVNLLDLTCMGILFQLFTSHSLHILLVRSFDVLRLHSLHPSPAETDQAEEQKVYFSIPTIFLKQTLFSSDCRSRLSETIYCPFNCESLRKERKLCCRHNFNII